MSNKARTDHPYPKSLGSHSTPSHVRASSRSYGITGFSLCLRNDHPALALSTRLRLGWEPWLRSIHQSPSKSAIALRAPAAASIVRLAIALRAPAVASIVRLTFSVVSSVQFNESGQKLTASNSLLHVDVGHSPQSSCLSVPFPSPTKQPQPCTQYT